MNLETRILSSQTEFDACIQLQKRIWGLEELGQTSPITLKALSITSPPVGLIMGGFDGENMVGMAIVIGTMEAGLAYGHMLGILDEYRDHKLGSSLHMALVKELKKRGIREMAWTFEPLESRNAHLYINRQGGRGVAYQADCFQVETTMHDGLSLDRMLMRVDIDNPPRQLESVSLTEVLRRYPLAGSGHMPEADGVLVEIPGDLASLKEQDMARARSFRADTRAVFSEYLNKRGFEAKQFFSGKTVDGRQSYYLLRRA